MSQTPPSSKQFAASLPSLVSWMTRHGDAETLPILTKVVTSLRSEHGVALIGAVGYCWGGRYVVLASHPGVAFGIDAFAACHPSRVDVGKDIEPISKPGMWCLAPDDALFPRKAVNKTRAILTSKSNAPPAAAGGGGRGGLEFIITEYPGVKHGFAVRGDENDATVTKARQDVLEATAAFFDRHLK
jgi:dienelactone hydrolase